MVEYSERQEVFIKLLNEHSALLHKVCNVYCEQLIDRQDLFQEIVVQLWKSYPNFRGDSKFSTWLYRIALNTAISGFRKHRIPVISFDPGTFHEPVSMESDADREEQVQKMYSAIKRLSDVEKGIIMMYLEEKSYEEMEEVFGISQNTLRVKINRIKEKLRKITIAGNYGAG